MWTQERRARGTLKANELRDTEYLRREIHCENHKGTQITMVRRYKENKRRQGSEEGDNVEAEL